eukprot:COSAG06_NODE_3955_length_4723_cov_2.210162_1_plen_56_part_10
MARLQRWQGTATHACVVVTCYLAADALITLCSVCVRQDTAMQSLGRDLTLSKDYEL